MADQEALVEPQTMASRPNPWMYATIGLVILLAVVLLGGRLYGGFSGGQEYRSQIDGFSLRYPTGWKVLSREEMAKFQGMFVFAAERKRLKAVFGVRSAPLEAKAVDLDEVATALDKNMPKNFADFNKLSQAKLKLNGKEALEYEYTFASQDKSKVRERLVIVVSSKRVFHLAAWAPVKTFAKAGGDFDQMIRTFSAE